MASRGGKTVQEGDQAPRRGDKDTVRAGPGLMAHLRGLMMQEDGQDEVDVSGSGGTPLVVWLGADNSNKKC